MAPNRKSGTPKNTATASAFFTPSQLTNLATTLTSLSTPSLYNSYRESSGLSTTNQREVHFRSVDFFDYGNILEGNGVFTYWWNLTQNFLGVPSGTSGAVISRPKRVSVWVLPRASNGNMAHTSFACLSGVPGKPASGDATVLANSRNTLVRPTFNVKWRKVLSASFDTLFRNTEFSPLTSASGNAQALFQLALVNPDDGSQFDDEVQVAVQVDWAEVLPPQTSISVGNTTSPSFGVISDPGLAETYAMVEAVSLQDAT